MLAVNAVHAGYGRTVVLRDVSVSVQKGEIVTVLGSNGAGKTSLLRAVAGMTRIFEGSVLWHGDDIGSLPPHQRARRGIALVPEGRGLFPTLTTRDNLLMGAASAGVGRRAVEERLNRVLEIFPRVGERIGQRAGDLSGGEQQMVAIGRALMSDPELIMLDEPSLGLAPNIVTGVIDTIVELRNELGLGVLVVEQRAADALRICDRAYVLARGEVRLEVAGTALQDQDSIRAAYFATGER